MEYHRDVEGRVCSIRQESKRRQNAIREIFFLVNWLDDIDLYDVVPSKLVVPPEDTNILEVSPGTVCRVAYSGQFYKARVIECGNKAAVSKTQKTLEKQNNVKTQKCDVDIQKKKGVGIQKNDVDVQNDVDMHKDDGVQKKNDGDAQNNVDMKKDDVGVQKSNYVDVQEKNNVDVQKINNVEMEERNSIVKKHVKKRKLITKDIVNNKRLKIDEGDPTMQDENVMRIIKELSNKVANLEAVTKKLKIKVKLLSASTTPCTTPVKEIQPLVSTPSSTPLDEALEVLDNSKKSCPEIYEEPGYVIIYGQRVDRIKLQQAKLQSNPVKCALQLLGVLFSAEELTNGNPSGNTNSKDEARKKTITKLDSSRMKYIEDYITEKWPGEYNNTLLKKMTQKCTDTYNSRKDLRHT